MNEQERLDLEIKKMRIDYDIAAYNAQLIDVKRKLLELKRDEAKHLFTVKEIEDKILAKEIEKSNI